MKKKQSRIIIIVVLIAAGLLGVLAVTIAFLSSRIEDTTPQQVPANTELYSCEQLYVMGEGDNGEVRIRLTSEPVMEDEALVIGAKYKAPNLEDSPEGVPEITYTSFHFVINSDEENPVIIDAESDEVQIDQTSGDVMYTIEFDFDDWELLEEKSTLSVKVTPWGYSLSADQEGENSFDPRALTTETVKECFPITHDIDRGSPETDSTCIEAGETGIDEEIACPPDPETGEIPETCDLELPDCCEGLTKVANCTEPDDANQCAEPDSSCFICLTDTQDTVCDEEEGENICNSGDCSDAEPNFADPSEEEDEGEEEEVPDEDSDPDPDPDSDPDPGNPTGPTDTDPPPGVETSNFTVTKAGPTCVERVDPLNQADFKITITNADDSYEDLLQIKDKLPLGFTYVDGSSKINGEEDPTDTLLTVSVVGDSQELVWSTPDGWSINAGDIFEIEFSTIVGENAISGDNQNEVVVTPVNNPINSDSLRTEYVFQVEQSCTTPETGLFDNTQVKLGAGLLVIFVAGLLYYTNAGRKAAENVYGSKTYNAGSKTVDSAKMGFLKITQPREHFEKKMEKEDKKR